jgi:hypothetical protein
VEEALRRSGGNQSDGDFDCYADLDGYDCDYEERPRPSPPEEEGTKLRCETPPPHLARQRRKLNLLASPDLGAPLKRRRHPDSPSAALSQMCASQWSTLLHCE